MTRFAAQLPVLFFEEPTMTDHIPSSAPMRKVQGRDIWVITPAVRADMDVEARHGELRRQLANAMTSLGVARPLAWFYTPMMLPLIGQLQPIAVVYDCMDELSNFKFAPPELGSLERDLLARANVVFTGGVSLYEAKQHLNPNMHAVPSGVDVVHFGQARRERVTRGPATAPSPPRLGFFGVLDERLDLTLLAGIAASRPNWLLDVVGPVAKIDPATLPSDANITYHGPRNYGDLPGHLAEWDVALMPFALNASTEFISPTKTPEYLAGGVPVVSTAIRDVVRHYGQLDTVFIADDVPAFIRACEDALALKATADWTETDALLDNASWDKAFARMLAEICKVIDPGDPERSDAAAMSSPEHFDVIVVGAGFAGAVMAERLASDGNKHVLIIDKRPHIAGNAYDHYDAAGLLVHAYGPHIFHTNSKDIVDYLSRFTAWRPYEHRVLASVPNGLVPIPINRTTLNAVFELNLQTDDEAEKFLAGKAEPRPDIRTSEDVVINAVGPLLYEMFFRGYTRKQWGLDPSELDKSVTARIPTRTSTDDRYFTDRYQQMPLAGYTRMFERMLDHPNITVRAGVDYADIRDEISADLIVYTGPIDAYYGHCFGTLPYRSLRFEHETIDKVEAQGVGTVNHPDEATPFTRISEFKHLTGQTHSRTSIVREYPAAEGDPYYPIPRSENQARYKRYEALAEKETKVVFVGRLATYRYYNMDQVVGQALAAYRRLDVSKATALRTTKTYAIAG